VFRSSIERPAKLERVMTEVLCERARAFEEGVTLAIVIC
jgi:hypothetical protein